jgi:hypothetical protein
MKRKKPAKIPGTGKAASAGTVARPTLNLLSRCAFRIRVYRRLSAAKYLSARYENVAGALQRIQYVPSADPAG